MREWVVGAVDEREKYSRNLRKRRAGCIHRLCSKRVVKIDRDVRVAVKQHVRRLLCQCGASRVSVSRAPHW